MKLLICTQVVDKNHPILGFFHRWIEEFAKHFDEVHVICLEKGEYSLPSNVKVYSLGKENGRSRVKYVLKLLKLVYVQRQNYDHVFVHMNQEFILVAGFLWKSLGKKVVFWRNHYEGNFLTNLSCWLSYKVCFTSESSYTAKFKSANKMPIGIDTTIFTDDKTEKKNELLYVGRITSSKRVHVLLEALRFIKEKGHNFNLSVVGGTTSKSDEFFRERLEKYASEHRLKVNFVGPVRWYELPHFYSSHKLCVNLSSPGMFDKVIGEALSCNCPVLTTNTDIVAPGVVTIHADDFNPIKISDVVIDFLNNQEEKFNFRNYIVQHHSLEKTINDVSNLY